MATRGQIWKNAHNGDVVEMLECAKDTSGQHIRFLFTIKPGGFKPVEHLHLSQEEDFVVLSGELTYLVNGIKKKAAPGERIILPKGVKHTHYNDSKDTELLMIQTIRPALDSEPLMESIMGLSCDGKIKNGEPKFFQVLVWLKYFKAKTYLAKIPISLQNFLATILAPIGRLCGYKAVYKKYSGFDA